MGTVGHTSLVFLWKCTYEENVEDPFVEVFANCNVLWNFRGGHSRFLAKVGRDWFSILNSCQGSAKYLSR